MKDGDQDDAKMEHYSVLHERGEECEHNTVLEKVPSMISETDSHDARRMDLFDTFSDINKLSLTFSTVHVIFTD